MDLIKVLENKVAKHNQGVGLNQSDAREIEEAIQRALVAAMPNTLGETTFKGVGTVPSSGVPLTVESISAAIKAASEAEDAKAKANAAIVGAVISILIGAGVTALTGGTLSPTLATTVVGVAAPLLKN